MSVLGLNPPGLLRFILNVSVVAEEEAVDGMAMMQEVVAEVVLWCEAYLMPMR